MYGSDLGVATGSSSQLVQPAPAYTAFDRARDALMALEELEKHALAMTDRLAGPVPAQDASKTSSQPVARGRLGELDGVVTEMMGVVGRLHEMVMRIQRGVG